MPAVGFRRRSISASSEKAPAPATASAAAAPRRASTNSTPLGRKKPFFRCTMRIAPSMSRASPAAARRVSSPTTRASPPKNLTTAMSGPVISGRGAPIWVNAPVTPANPKTKSFCAPCAQKMHPATTRRIVRAASTCRAVGGPKSRMTGFSWCCGLSRGVAAVHRIVRAGDEARLLAAQPRGGAPGKHRPTPSAMRKRRRMPVGSPAGVPSVRPRRAGRSGCR